MEKDIIEGCRPNFLTNRNISLACANLFIFSHPSKSEFNKTSSGLMPEFIIVCRYSMALSSKELFIHPKNNYKFTLKKIKPKVFIKTKIILPFIKVEKVIISGLILLNFISLNLISASRMLLHLTQQSITEL